MEVFASGRITILVQDPRFRNFTVSGSLFNPSALTVLFDYSKRKTLSFAVCCISLSVREILIALLSVLAGSKYTGFVGLEGMRAGDHIRI